MANLLSDSITTMNRRLNAMSQLVAVSWDTADTKPPNFQTLIDNLQQQISLCIDQGNRLLSGQLPADRFNDWLALGDSISANAVVVAKALQQPTLLGSAQALGKQFDQIVVDLKAAAHQAGSTAKDVALSTAKIVQWGFLGAVGAWLAYKFLGDPNHQHHHEEE